MRDQLGHKKTMFYHRKMECEVKYSEVYKEEEEECQGINEDYKSSQIYVTYPLKRTV
jgi:hypothetical protein